VATIAKGWRLGQLATAEEELFGFGGDVLNRRATGSLVGAIAKGWGAAFATGTPVVGFALFNGYGKRPICCSEWNAHNVLHGWICCYPEYRSFPHIR